MAKASYNQHSMQRGNQRQSMIDQGGYDGRFAGKTFKDKKKDQNRRESRDWKKSLKAYCY